MRNISLIAISVILFILIAHYSIAPTSSDIGPNTVLQPPQDTLSQPKDGQSTISQPPPDNNPIPTDITDTTNEEENIVTLQDTVVPDTPDTDDPTDITVPDPDISDPTADVKETILPPAEDTISPEMETILPVGPEPKAETIRSITKPDSDTASEVPDEIVTDEQDGLIVEREPPKAEIFSNQFVKRFSVTPESIKSEEYDYVEERRSITRENAVVTSENIRIEKEVEVYEKVTKGISEKNSIIRIKIIPKKVMRNFALYENIPKTIAPHASDIIFYEGNYDYYQIVEQDPLIVWHFKVVDSDIEVAYGIRKEVNEEDVSLGFSVTVADVEEQEAFSPASVRAIILFGGLMLLGSAFVMRLALQK